MPKISVLLIEDQTLTRLGVKAIFAESQEIELTAVAENTVEGLNAFKRIRPDVTLLGLRLPDSCAVDSIADFLEIEPQARIIILAANSGDSEIARSLRRGAFGFVLKDVSAEQLIKAVKTVYANKKFVPANVAGILSEHLGEEQLTEREQKILRLIVNGLSNKEIAHNLGITENTVKTHVKNILSKLNVSDRTAAATTAIKRGMVRIN